MIKLNIFSRLDDHAISDLAVKMFRVPTSSGMRIIEEGDAGEVFYVVRHGSYDVTVDKNNPMNKKTITLAHIKLTTARFRGSKGLLFNLKIGLFVIILQSSVAKL